MNKQKRSLWRWIKARWTLWLWPVFLPPFEKYSTILFYGPRSAGKSLHQARMGLSILRWLDALYYLHPELPQAIVMSNQVFNASIEKKWLGRNLFYWENIQQLRWCPRAECLQKLNEHGVPTPHHRMHGAYVIFDDIATILPADGWADKPTWFRKMFAQGAHNGIHVIANVQDPMSCDINFRRYTDVCVKIRKVFGSRRPEREKPPVRVIYGIYTTRSVGADELFKNGDMTEDEIQRWREEHPENSEGSWTPAWYWIWPSLTRIYNTLQNVPEYMPGALEHRETFCSDPNCTYTHVTHRPI